MKTPDRLRTDQKVRVEIHDSEGHLISNHLYTGLHTIQEAVKEAANATLPSGAHPEDYVYTVTDVDTGTTGRYRINAHGHIDLLPEE